MKVPMSLRAAARDGLMLLGCLLLLFNGSLALLASVYGFAEGWKAWAMPVTGAVMLLVATRMVYLRIHREIRIRRAGHLRVSWGGRGKRPLPPSNM